MKRSWETIVGPKWFGFLVISTVGITGILVGRNLSLGRPISGTLAFVILIANIALLVYHLWWVFDIVHDSAYSKGQRDTLERFETEDREE